MKLGSSALAGGLLLSASFGAYAQAPAPDMQLRMDRGFYVAAGVGKSRTGEGCVAACDTTDRTWNVSAGYMFNRNLGVEAGYVDMGTHTLTTTLAGVIGTHTTENTAVELLGVLMLPFTEKWGIYAKAGMYRAKADSVTAGAGGATGKDTDTGFTFGAGLQYLFTPNFAVRGEWQSYNDIPTGVIGLVRDDLHAWRVGVRAKF